ncbi:anaphase-promoting complex subunit 2-like [Oscarella lobularis]|uniref:anaphase-promoting complex subunit 2-like n=1 Tax=Oscarella lobularis TaxID=121494 RepID=UPI003313DF0C
MEAPSRLLNVVQTTLRDSVDFSAHSDAILQIASIKRQKRLLLSSFLGEFNRICAVNLSESFWSVFSKTKSLVDAVNYLHDYVLKRKSFIDFLGDCLVPLVRDLWVYCLDEISNSVFVFVPYHVEDEACSYFEDVFATFTELRESGEVIDKAKLKNAENLFKKLRELHLFEVVFVKTFNNWINHKVISLLESNYSGQYEEPLLEKAISWIDNIVLSWLQFAFGSESLSSQIDLWKDRLHHLVYKAFSSMRMLEMFDIIVDYPESEAAIIDLKECWERIDEKKTLIKILKTSFKRRLLHPGADTTDILTHYVSTIKSLRLLDPTGIVLEQAGQPVREYLRHRDDTVRRIVSSLIDSSSGELSEELMQNEPVLIEESDGSDYEDAENWMPDPIDADPSTSKSRKSSDIMSLLVNIYGSKELFIVEYQSLLADRVLSSLDYNTEKEVRNLELLKLRFGETSLHYCEIMLKDLAESKRLNGRIHEQTELPIDVNCLILSGSFWPTLKEEKFKVPESVQKAMDAYGTAFSLHKANRKLEWREKFGVVDLAVEMKDRTLECKVSSAQASVLMAFQDQDSWKVEDLSKRIEMTPGLLEKRLAFWINKGVLKKDADGTYYVVEVEERNQADSSHEMIDEEENDSTVAQASDREEEKLQTCWSFIVSMLTNLGQLPLERIHSMLKMFAIQGPSGATTEITPRALRVFLDAKVREDKLAFSNNAYRLS